MTYFLAGAVLVGFGAARAIWRRARSDHAATKQAVKSLRKAKWSAFFKMLRVGIFAAIIGGLLVFWFGTDVRDSTKTEVPASVDHSPSVKPSRTRGR